MPTPMMTFKRWKWETRGMMRVRGFMRRYPKKVNTEMKGNTPT